MKTQYAWILTYYITKVAINSRLFVTWEMGKAHTQHALPLLCQKNKLNKNKIIFTQIPYWVLVTKFLQMNYNLRSVNRFQTNQLYFMIHIPITANTFPEAVFINYCAVWEI